MNPTAVKVFWGNISVLFVLLGAVVCLFIATEGAFDRAHWVAFYVAIAIATGLVFCLFTSNSKGEYTNKKLGISLGGGAGIGACFMVLASFLTPGGFEDTLFLKRGDLLALDDLEEVFDDSLSAVSDAGQDFFGIKKPAFVTLTKNGYWNSPIEDRWELSTPTKGSAGDYMVMKQVLNGERFKDLRRGDEGEYWLAPAALMAKLTSADKVGQVKSRYLETKDNVRIVAKARIVSAMAGLPTSVQESVLKHPDALRRCLG